MNRGEKKSRATINRTLTEGQFYIVVLPGMLHYVDVCLYLIPEQVQIKLVLNGVKGWEKQYISRRHPELETCSVNPFPRSVMSHGKVLNQLIEDNSDNFGIIDYDLFLFGDHIFDAPEPFSNELAIGLYKLVNKHTAHQFPTTHFLYLNTTLIKRLTAKYGVTVYQKRAPRHLRPTLRSLGYGKKKHLKDYLDYYDTLNLVMAMGIHDGYKFRFLDSSGAFHVGATSRRTGYDATNYASYRLLSLRCNDELRDRYRKHYKRLRKVFTASATPIEKISPAGFRQIDHFIELLASLNFGNRQ